MDLFRSIQDFFNNLTPDELSVLIEIGVAALVLPIVTQVARWVTRVKTENAKWLLALGLAIVSGAVAYVHGNPPAAGTWFAGALVFAQGAINYVTSQPVYRFGFKQLFAKIKEVWLNELAKAYENKRSEAQEAAHLVVEPTAPEFLP